MSILDENRADADEKLMGAMLCHKNATKHSLQAGKEGMELALQPPVDMRELTHHTARAARSQVRRIQETIRRLGMADERMRSSSATCATVSQETKTSGSGASVISSSACEAGVGAATGAAAGNEPPIC